MAELSEPQPGNTLATVSGAVGVVLGLAVGRYTGLGLLIPVVMAVALGWPFARFSHGRRKTVTPAFAVHAGQWVWVLIYILATLPAANWSFFIDFVVLLIGTAWLLIAPAMFPLAALAVFQAIMLVVNLLQRSTYADIGDWHATSLSIQIFMRTVALVLLGFSLRSYQKLIKAEGIVNPLASF